METRYDKGHDENHQKVKYFLPGQIIWHMQHSANVSPARLARAINTFLTGGSDTGDDDRLKKSSSSARTRDRGSAPEGQSWRSQLEQVTKEAIVTFPLRDDRGFAFSIVKLNLQNRKAGPQELAALLRSIHADMGRSGSLIISGSITLNFAYLNSLVSDGHHGTSTGGPGGWPVEAHPPDGEHWMFRWQDRAARWVRLPDGQRQGRNVHVAILDTVPTRHAMDTAYAERRWQHRLIESLLGPNGPLNLYPATFSDFSTLPPTAQYSLRGHRYWMRDHGLFVAGIIHSIAPRAILHMVEVLNPYGVGSWESVTRGLEKVVREPRIGRPLIINCSFTLNIPVEGVRDDDFPEELRDPVILQQMIDSFNEVFTRVAGERNVVIVACAGNDRVINNSNPNGDRPHARYPAAFDSVQGVGALPRESVNPLHRAATYSNLSDEPVAEGIITLGGEPGYGRGVLGVFIDDFPVFNRVEWFILVLLRFLRLFPGRPGHLPRNFRALQLVDVEYRRNTTGWAWWAGTSFAAPIVSGILASWRSEPANSTGPFDLRTARGVLNGLGGFATPEGERVIVVRQEA